jgi:hypothetical protein
MSKDSFAARAALVAVPEPVKPAGKVRVAPVKMTVDVDQAAYKFVSSFAEVQGVALAVGKVRVPTVETFRAMLQLLEEDEELARRVANRMVENLT